MNPSARALQRDIVVLDEAVAGIFAEIVPLQERVRAVRENQTQLRSQLVAELDPFVDEDLVELFTLSWSGGQGNRQADAALVAYFRMFLSEDSFYQVERRMREAIMMVRVETAVALSRPPQADRWSTVMVEAESESAAFLVAWSMAAGRPDVAMVVHVEVVDIWP